jgi:hypothetical protein
VIDEKTGMIEISWNPENSSTQDSYKLQYHEVETTIGGDSNTLTTDKTKVSILRNIFFALNNKKILQAHCRTFWIAIFLVSLT